ncbi:zinc finger and BTB domain-containing protein 32-like [Hyalella azteca]|uniref:Zinc finger and BTB domain-containing protein 32-like n=1 Tax=Hyalella azteca TaxID=294128 RepID=A0A979FTG6_HYAAZ|nr:zinc finger and BTB domain-containing protein 32-like [Hyalella azteca]
MELTSLLRLHVKLPGPHQEFDESLQWFTQTSHAPLRVDNSTHALSSSLAAAAGAYKRRHRTKPGTCVPVVPFDQLPNVGPISHENPFRCPVCGMDFFDKTRFRSHYMVHTGEQPYACHLCPFKARQSCNLKRHVREKHELYSL